MSVHTIGNQGNLTYLSLFLSFLDPNCIHIRAPSSKEGSNLGNFDVKEHIGHLKKEYSSLFAPIFDQYELNDDVTFHIHLNYSDTNHSRVGYDVDVVVMSDCSITFNEQLIQKFFEAALNPRII